MTAPHASRGCARLSARARPRAARSALRAALAAPAAPAREAALGWKPAVAGALAFAGCFAYAFVRYVLVKGEPLASVPLYVTNKALAVVAVLLVGAAAARPRAAWRSAARTAALLAAALHALASVVLLRPAYLASLYAPSGRLSASGELAVLCGASALVAFGALRLARPAALAAGAARLAAQGALALVGVHCAALGAPGWFAPATWPGRLPPLTLLGALAAAVGLAATLSARGGTASARARPARASPPRAAGSADREAARGP
ncbi:hypothetical protein [Anaeromyxobacter soli]|uniref:hypothetical protein n=1 Tax=Anaeromyxobacter soli TaxID=2922725 RepID=UPI001FAF2C3E|nr:hypothetical protein [Anaeromyxobacter sp. SG29]